MTLPCPECGQVIEGNLDDLWIHRSDKHKIRIGGQPPTPSAALTQRVQALAQAVLRLEDQVADLIARTAALEHQAAKRDKELAAALARALNESRSGMRVPIAEQVDEATKRGLAKMMRETPKEKG